MKLTYEEQEFVIIATDENGKQWFIPKDEGNSDYQRYLNPEAEHFTPSLTDADKS
jgi:hypothetical protein